VVRWILLITILGSAGPAFGQATAARLEVPSPAQGLFEKDWVLMNWALKHFDWNRDIRLEPQEAQAAADAFRKLADMNHDGRITPEEYAAARAAILSHD
jgi:hypothetical protein